MMPVPRCVTREQTNAVTYWVLGKDCRTVRVGAGAVQQFVLLVWELSLSHSPHGTYPELGLDIFDLGYLTFWGCSIEIEKWAGRELCGQINIPLFPYVSWYHWGVSKKKVLLTDYLFCGFFKLSFKQEWSHKLNLRHTAQILKTHFQKICIFHFLFSYSAQLTCEL